MTVADSKIINGPILKERVIYILQIHQKAAEDSCPPELAVEDRSYLSLS